MTVVRDSSSRRVSELQEDIQCRPEAFALHGERLYRVHELQASSDVFCMQSRQRVCRMRRTTVIFWLPSIPAYLSDDSLGQKAKHLVYGAPLDA